MGPYVWSIFIHLLQEGTEIAGYTPLQVMMNKIRNICAVFAAWRRKTKPVGYGGKVNYILDNLIAKNQRHDCSNELSLPLTMKRKKSFRRDFDSMLMKDCIPFIEKKFKLLKGMKTGQWQGCQWAAIKPL